MRVFIAMGLIVVGFWCMVAVAYYLYIGFGLFRRFFHDWLGFHRPDDRNVWMQGYRRHCRCKVCHRVLVLTDDGDLVVKE